MTTEDKATLVRCILWLAILVLMYHMTDIYYARDRVQIAQQDYIAEKMQSYKEDLDDDDLNEAIRLYKWLKQQGVKRP